MASIVLTLVALGVGAILAFVLAEHFTRPIQSIVMAATRIGAGDFKARVKVRRNDEFGILADSINQMAQSLDTGEEESVRAKHTINSLNAGLEQKVIERTTELKFANAALRESEARKQNPPRQRLIRLSLPKIMKVRFWSLIEVRKRPSDIDVKR